MVRVDQATWKERWILWAHPRGRRRMQLHDDDPRGGKSGCWLVGCLTVGPRVEGRTTWKEEPRGRKSCRLMVGPRGRKSTSVGNLSTNEYKH